MKIIRYLCFGSSGFGFITSSEPSQAGWFVSCHEYLASRLKGNVKARANFLARQLCLDS
jgi:hypothetical protein